MNDNLAVSLLAKVTKWDNGRLSKELPKLSFMARTKYDAYSQFDPGFRFMSSFAQWMAQFDKEDVETIYSALKDHLAFVSMEQIKYLMDLMYSSKIKPYIRAASAGKAGFETYQLKRIENSIEYRIQKRLLLVVGLSDGSHTDILRRTAGFSNEQVLPMYYPNQEKLQDVYDELQKDELLKGTDRKLFESLLLVDDFTASGISFARKEGHEFKGKIIKVLKGLKQRGVASEGGVDDVKDIELSDLFVKDAIKVNVLFCVATENAIDNINREVRHYLNENGLASIIRFNVDCVQLIKSEGVETLKANSSLKNALKKYYDGSQELSGSYKKGVHVEPYWGFNECGLLLVLSHNTPNNTLPLIWANTSKFKGLFPRINRH